MIEDDYEIISVESTVPPEHMGGTDCHCYVIGQGEIPVQCAGLRYFNVYGPGEGHKGRMASVAWHFRNQYRDSGKVRLFAGSDGLHSNC